MKKFQIKKIFREIFATRKSKLAFFACIVSFVMLIGVTFSWFYSIIYLPQSEISTGYIDYVVKGYDEYGNFISTIIDPNAVTESTVNPNAPLFNLNNLSANNYTTAYISIENSGPLDMEFSLKFNVTGTNEALENVGGFWFKVEELTSLVYSNVTDANGNKIGEEDYDAKTANYEPVINDYYTKNGDIISCSKECIDNGSTLCTEHSPYSRNLSTLNTYATYGSLKGTKKVTVYRIDIGLRSQATPIRYNGINLIISGEVYGAQVGGVNGNPGYNKIYTVIDSKTLDLAIENALPGDTIQLAEEINYFGDLIFNKCINIITYGHDLKIHGNLIFDFVTSYPLKLNLSYGGNIEVIKENSIGGDLQINTPNSNVQITGNNFLSSIYVYDDATFNVSNAPDTPGMLLSGTTIKNKDGHPKDIDVNSNSRITVDYGVELARIEALPNATYIEIVNYGIIDTINLSNMLLVDNYPELPLVDSEAPQIIIDNYYRIVSPIQLPAWSTAYVLEKNNAGYYEGNTLIYRQLGADTMSILADLCPYANEDIIDFNVKNVCVVQKVSGKNDKLVVYYGNRKNSQNIIEELSIKDLLVEYFIEYYKGTISEAEALEHINNVVYLEVLSLTDIMYDEYRPKEVTNDDIKFMNKNMERLASINLEQSVVTNNTIGASSFENKKVLTEIILPSTLERIEDKAFSNTSIKSIRFPAKVTFYSVNSIDTIPYIFFDSITPVLPNGTRPIDLNKHHYFVKESVIDNYREKWGELLTGHKTRIHVDGVFTDDGLHVVREGVGGYELIVYFGSETNLKIGEGLTINEMPITINTIKRYAYTLVENNFYASFSSSILTLEEYAFYNSKVMNIELNNVRSVGYETFSYCTYLTSIDTKNVEFIDEYGFYNCTNLHILNCPNVLTIGANAFGKCAALGKITFGMVKEIGDGALSLGVNNSVISIDFNNDSFEGCTFSAFKNNENVYFKVFVKKELITSFVETGFVSRNMVYAQGDIIGTNIQSRTTSFNVTTSFNIGNYVVSKEQDNVELITYYATNITEDFTVPGTVIIGEGVNAVTKTIVKVGDFCFRKIKFERIVLIFSPSITEVGHYAFYGQSGKMPTDHGSATVSEYYNKIYKIIFNNVSKIGQAAFHYLPELEIIDGNNKIKEIKDSAFMNCSALFTVDLPLIESLGSSNETLNRVFSNCKQLVSIKFGKNLSKIYGNDMINSTCTKLRELVIEAEITSNDYNQYFIQSNYAATYNSNFKLYVPISVIDSQNSTYTAVLHEYGEPYGTNIVQNTAKTLSHNLGEFKYTTTTIDNVTGITIADYTYKNATSSFAFPTKIDNLDVICIGYNCFKGVNFASAPTLNESGEHFVFNDKLLQLSSYAFSGSNARFSQLPGVKYIYDYGIHSCSNIYLIEAPNLLKVASYVFNSCVNLKVINTPKLQSCGGNFVQSSSPVALFTNITEVGSVSWLSNSKIRLITLAMDDGAELTLGTNIKMPTGLYRCVLTNPTVAQSYSNLNNYHFYSNQTYKLGGEYTYNILDSNGSIIYTYQLYEFLINKEGNTVTIVKSLVQAYTEDLYLPSVLDGRPVTKIDGFAFMNTSFNRNQVIFPNSIVSIAQNAFNTCGIGGVLNLNQVTSVGYNSFSSNYFTALIAPKLTSGAGASFGRNTSLTTVYLHSFEIYKDSYFSGSSNIKYVYTEVLPTFSTNNVFATTSDISFIINVDITSASQIPTKNWTIFKNITMYVPYNSVEIYKSVFETSTYNNFTVLPYGIVEADEETGNVMILEEIENGYAYNEETGTLESVTVYKLNSLLSALENVVIPDEYNGIKITIIDDNAFVGQESVRNIMLPKYLLTYGQNALNNVTNLTSISIDEDAPHYSTHDGVLYTKNYVELVHYPKEKFLTEYSILDGTQTIRSNAFKEVKSLEKLIIPSSVKVIGLDAFIDSSIMEFDFNCQAPLVLGNNIFNTENDTIVIWVPNGTLANYQTVSAFVYFNVKEKDAE